MLVRPCSAHLGVRYIFLLRALTVRCLGELVRCPLYARVLPSPSHGLVDAAVASSPTPSVSSGRSRLPDGSRLTEIVETNLTVDDVLTPFFFNNDPMVVLAALDVYVRRAYRAYDLRDVVHVMEDSTRSSPLTEWHFRFPENPNECTAGAAPPLHGVRVAAARAKVLTGGWGVTTALFRGAR